MELLTPGEKIERIESFSHFRNPHIYLILIIGLHSNDIHNYDVDSKPL